MSRVIVKRVADVWYSTPHEKKIIQQEGEKARRKEHDMVLDYKLVPFGIKLPQLKMCIRRALRRKWAARGFLWERECNSHSFYRI